MIEKLNEYYNVKSSGVCKTNEYKKSKVLMNCLIANSINFIVSCSHISMKNSVTFFKFLIKSFTNIKLTIAENRLQSSTTIIWSLLYLVNCGKIFKLLSCNRMYIN